jgi:hypothetical protein
MNQENLYTKDCIRTYAGHYLNPFLPDPEKIWAEDIAHALAHQCRFGGHLPVFYSVAQHSVEVSRHVAPQHAMAALLHDASEAYLLDMPSPIKRRLSDYKAVEDIMMRAIAERYHFEFPLHESIKRVDNIMCEVEWHQLMLKGKPGDLHLIPHHNPKQLFLDRFRELRNAHSATHHKNGGGHQNFNTENL